MADVNISANVVSGSAISTDLTEGVQIVTNVTESSTITSNVTTGGVGASAYQVWLSEGNTGSVADYLLSLKGDQGDQGDPGVVQSIVAGTGISVDSTDPANPIVSGPQTYDEYIYNSSGAQSGNRYNDWGDLYTAFNTGQDGPVRITFEQNETLPTGTYNLDYVTFNGDGKIAVLGGLVVTLPNGFLIDGTWVNGMLDGGLGLVWEGNSPALDYASGINLFSLTIGNTITSVNAPFFSAGSGSVSIIRLATGSQLINGGYEPVLTESGATFYTILGGSSSSFGNNIFRGVTDSFATLILVDSPSSGISLTRTDANLTGTTEIILNSSSTLISYDPTISGLSSTTVKTAIDELASGGGGGGVWGSITGTLSNQTDLQNALDAKVSSVVAGTGISVDNTDPKNPIVTNSSTATTFLYRDVNQTGHGLAVGDIVRISGGVYVKAQADSLANANAVGMVQTVTDANNFRVASDGYITGISFSPNSTLFYLSPTTAGALTSTKPTTVGQVVKPLYVSVGTTRGYLNCDFEPTLVKTASRALVSDTNGDVVASSVTSTELGYVSGVTSAIQTQIDGKISDTGDTMTGDLVITESSSNAANYNLSLENSSATATSPTGINFRNSAGLVNTARITANPGSTYTNSSLKVEVADSSKALQTRMNIDVAGVVTVPTAQGSATNTIVATDHTQTLTNKTLDNTNTLTIRDDRFTLQDNLDNTKQLVFQLASLASATTHTITFIAGMTVAGISTTQTLTNKRITKRVTAITSSATPTINTDNCDAVTITALATAITSMTTNLTGTPNNFDQLIFRIKDDGTARAITWGASFEAKGVALPTTTVISKVLTVGFIYDTVTSKWGCIASASEL